MTPTPLDGKKISIGNQILQVQSYLKGQNSIDENRQVIIDQQEKGIPIALNLHEKYYLRHPITFRDTG